MTIFNQVKRKVFISYHHANDQWYCDQFRQQMCGYFDLLTDNSLQRALNSDNTTYIDRKVREEYIWGSSVTIVLCGAQTHKRKFVDWEIAATLHYDHALLGIILPSCQSDGWTRIVPARLQDNLNSGYAHSIPWGHDPYTIKHAIETAITKNYLSLKRNTRAQMGRNAA
jgi:hypothetical protein